MASLRISLPPIQEASETPSPDGRLSARAATPYPFDLGSLSEESLCSSEALTPRDGSQLISSVKIRDAAQPDDGDVMPADIGSGSDSSQTSSTASEVDSEDALFALELEQDFGHQLAVDRLPPARNSAAPGDVKDTLAARKRPCSDELPRPKLPRLAGEISPLVLENPLAVVCVTPVSPNRHFSDILAERTGPEGKMFKVEWRTSWIHEHRINKEDLEEIWLDRYSRDGRGWPIVE